MKSLTYITLILSILAFGCGGSAELDCKDFVTSTEETNIDSVKIYLDNSVSMRGVICHPTQFNSRVSEFVNFIGLPNYYDSKVGYYMLSDKMESYSKGDFLEVFYDKDINAINGKGTPLLDMLGDVIHENQKHQVSIIVTDAIFSGNDTTELKQKTTDAIAKAVKRKRIAMKIYQLTSDFHHESPSLYYTKDGPLNQSRTIFEDFAYYILIIGEYDVVKSFDNKLYQKRYQNEGIPFEFNIDTLELSGHHTLLYRKRKNANYKVRADKDTRERITEMEITKGEDEVKFSVLLNTNRQLEDYDGDNYYYDLLLNGVPIKSFKTPILHKTVDDNIFKFYPKSSRAQKHLECFQYLLEFNIQSRGLQFLEDNELVLVKRRTRPSFDFINTHDDTKGPKSGQTYGIKHFFDGIEDGFNNEKEETTIYEIHIPFKVN